MNAASITKHRLLSDIRAELVAQGHTVTTAQLAAMARFLARLDRCCNCAESDFLTALRTRLITV